MKKKNIRLMPPFFLVPFLLFNFLFLSFSLSAQTGLRNNGTKLIIPSGAVVRIAGSNGDFTNASSGGQDGSIDLSGKLKLEGDWENNAAGGDLLDGTTGTVVFDGGSTQTVGGSRETHWQNIEIVNGATLELGSGQNMTVDQSLSNSGTLSLKSDAGGQASLIQPSSGVDAEVERYLTQSDYHYISAPVNNQNISTEFVNTTTNPLPSNIDFYKFDEPANLWRNIKDGSGNLNTSFETQFVVNRGYAYANNSATETKIFSGTLNYASQTVNMTRTSGTGSEGWNLVGNPFPATLAANSNADATNNFLTDNATVLDDNYEAIYLWDGNDYGVVNQASAATFISPGQGFFVNAASNGAQLQINANIQKHSSATFYKSQNTLARFIIGITGPQSDYNETYISFIQGTTKGLDPGYDARKLKGNPNIALFSKLVDDDGGDYAIQSLPIVENQQVYLGLDAMQPGLYQFGNVQMENLPCQTVLLEDKQENVFLDLNVNQTYSFSTNQSAMNFENRFLLHFGGIITENPEIQSASKDVTIFSNGDFIFIQNLSKESQSGPWYLYNMAGQLVQTANVDIEGHSCHTIPTKYATGIYLVRFVGNESLYTQKVILK